MNVHQTLSPISVNRKKGSIRKGRIGDHARSLRHVEHYFFFVMLLDMLFLNACMLGSLNFFISFGELMAFHTTPFLLFILSYNMLAVAVASFLKLFHEYEGTKLELKLTDLLTGSIVYFGIMSLVYYQLFFPVFEVHFLLPACGLFILLSSLTHSAVRRAGRIPNSILTYAVIGGKSSGVKYLENIFRQAYGKRALCVGRFGNSNVQEVIRLGNYSDIKMFLAGDHGINKLVYLDNDLSQREIKDIVQLCRINFVDFEIVPPAVNFFDQEVQMGQLAHLPIFFRKKEPLCLLKNKVMKRSFDIVFSLFMIVGVFPWLFPIIALLVKLDSRGPVFFTQMRTGYWNKPFKCLKFRSMRMNGECDRKQAVENDKRITRIGNFLRKSSLDELPQFFNVLKGEMSVVGPRPHMLVHTEEYSRLIDIFMIRHAVKPGITGWAQVSGWRGPTPELYQMAKRVEYDMDYIENWSFWLDLKCIFLTACNIFRREKNAC